MMLQLENVSTNMINSNEAAVQKNDAGMNCFVTINYTSNHFQGENTIVPID